MRNLLQTKNHYINNRYVNDIYKIVASDEYANLAGKTQVFLHHKQNKLSNRQSHTISVRNIAVTIGHALGANVALCAAGALGHDLGHTPFGHSGERAIQTFVPEFEHCKQSYLVAKKLKLNRKTQDAILNHRSSGNPSTLEGAIVQIADKTAYLVHDYADCLKLGLNITLPTITTRLLGDTPDKIQTALLSDLITTTRNTGILQHSELIDSAKNEMRTYMFDAVYQNKAIKTDEPEAEMIVKTLFNHYSKSMNVNDVINKIVSMTDYTAIQTYMSLTGKSTPLSAYYR